MVVDSTTHKIPQTRGLLPLIENDRSRGGEQLLGHHLEGCASRFIDIYPINTEAAATSTAVRVLPTALGPSMSRSPIAAIRRFSSPSTTRGR